LAKDGEAVSLDVPIGVVVILIGVVMPWIYEWSNMRGYRQGFRDGLRIHDCVEADYNKTMEVLRCPKT
jgi:hypothetical protein